MTSRWQHGALLAPKVPLAGVGEKSLFFFSIFQTLLSVPPNAHCSRLKHLSSYSFDEKMYWASVEAAVWDTVAGGEHRDMQQGREHFYSLQRLNMPIPMASLWYSGREGGLLKVPVFTWGN